MSPDPFTMERRLCDDDGMVNHSVVATPDPRPADLTYLQQINNLRGHSGHPPVTEPFGCTGHAHLAGEHIRCTSPAHNGAVIAAILRHLAPGYWRDRVWQEIADANLEHDSQHEQRALDELARLPEQRDNAETPAATPLAAVGQVLTENGWRTIVTSPDLDYVGHCLAYPAYNGLAKRIHSTDANPTPGVSS